ncbi:hypothetical protein ADZ36_00790 [Streptomyces fradiae]|uniref:Uncharacterized protein n=2 Tax=Streptomyces TaxID=1883 RepID=A0A3M8F8G2_9ACTN|nr:hypothetical protein ADZ36_00790 [Streptomyces fradiae]PQM22130.1 hypothetical protein Sfr7A_17965 [Streptomyces xinghaiensis]RKM95380.1 hypothetical protein SFRA_015090 [Streptomyces xinghaiensis]RNC72964.1 hypothetical protein DC095_017515 [Streptomyces xinghaiensis]
MLAGLALRQSGTRSPLPGPAGRVRAVTRRPAGSAPVSVPVPDRVSVRSPPGRGRGAGGERDISRGVLCGFAPGVSGSQ